MSIWGTLATVGAGVGATILTGNPATGAAAAGAVNSLVGSGGRCNPPSIGDVQIVLANLSPSERASWAALDSGKMALSQAMYRNDAAALVSMVANSSCDPPHPFIQRLYELIQLTPGTSNTTAPAVSVTNGGGSPLISGVKDYATGILGAGAAAATQAAQAGGTASQAAAAGSSIGGSVARYWPIALVLLIVFLLLRKAG
jgi:hypothetical protein